MKQLKLLLYLLIFTTLRVTGQNKDAQLIISSNVDQTSKLVQIDVTIINNSNGKIKICPLHFDCEDYSDIFWTLDISNDYTKFRPFSKIINVSQCYPICKEFKKVKAGSKISMKFCIDFSTLIRLEPSFGADKNRIDSIEKDYALYMNPPGYYILKLRYHYYKGSDGIINNLESNEIKIEYKK